MGFFLAYIHLVDCPSFNPSQSSPAHTRPSIGLLPRKSGYTKTLSLLLTSDTHRIFSPFSSPVISIMSLSKAANAPHTSPEVPFELT